jgi:hypothetical protein
MLVYKLLRQTRCNYRSQLIIRISLPPPPLSLSLSTHHLLTKFLPSLTIQLNFHLILTTCNKYDTLYKSYNVRKILTRHYSYLLRYSHVHVN